ncbi:glutathione synthetase [Streptomyces sp. 5.8]|uniref:glutathione synthetase n=1 Tax=Streptomyces sp. 5.8 TaxID=3406571 RepID=UPI003BB60777
MALAAPAPAAAPPAHRRGAVAIVAPTGAGDLYAPALAQHGWGAVAVTVPGTDPSSTADAYSRIVAHRASVRRTAQQLADLGVQAVLAGSPAGTVLAERLAARLHLPGNDPDTAVIRRDTGLTSAALLTAGITAPRSIRTTRLSEALEWSAFTQVPDLVLEHPDPVNPGATLCHTPDDIRSAWKATHHSGSQPLVLREHLPGTQYLIHTLTGPSVDGSTDHTITSIWSEIRTPHQQGNRFDLLNRRGLLARALALYTMRGLTALGVRYGPAHAVVTFIPDRGPALLSLRTDPYADVDSELLRQVAGHDPIRDTALLLTSGQRQTIPHQPRNAHVTKVALVPHFDGLLDPYLLRTLTTLPTVAATTGLHAGDPVRAGRVAGWLLLVAEASRAIDHDHRVIRAAENLGLYGSPA